MRERIAAVLAICLVIGMPAAAQELPAPSGAHTAAIDRLDFLVGRWHGSGWMLMGPDQKVTFEQTEDVQTKAGGTVLAIEGRGRNGAHIVHDAYAIVSFDAATRAYEMRSYLMQGQTATFPFSVTDRGFEWRMSHPQAGQIRYRMTLSADDTWVEVGERLVGEDRWVQFFEMTLTRQPR